MCILAILAYSDMEEIVLNRNPRMNSYPDKLIATLSELNGIRFAQLFLSDFIYKGFFFLYILSIVILTADIFAYDRENGTLKYTLLTGVTTKQVILGKVVVISALAFGLALLNFLISILLGVSFFGVSSFRMKELAIVLLMNILAAFPGIAMGMIVSILSLSRLAAKSVLIICIGFSFILGIADTVTLSKFYSPIGTLFLFNENFPYITTDYAKSLIVSFIYIVVLMGLMLTKGKKIEYN